MDINMKLFISYIFLIPGELIPKELPQLRLNAINKHPLFLIFFGLEL